MMLQRIFLRGIQVSHRRISNERSKKQLNKKRSILSKILVIMIIIAMVVPLAASMITANARDLYYGTDDKTIYNKNYKNGKAEDDAYSLKPMEYTELASSVKKAASLLSDLLEGSRTAKEKELDSMIDEKGYDRDLTMKSFYDNTEPFSETDLESLVAACCVVLKKAELNVAGIDFLKMQVTEQTVTEAIPVKTDEYTKNGKDTYEKTGVRYITEPTYIWKYAKDGESYKRIRKYLVEPDERKTVYGEVKLTPADAHDIFTQASISDSDADKMYNTILNSMKEDDTLSEDSLLQTIHFEVPSYDDISDNKTSDNLTDEEKEIVDNALDKVSGNRKTIIKTAVSLLGRIPYLWGGKPKKAGYDTDWWSFNSKGKQLGLDCSGFVEWTYWTAGFDKDTYSKLCSTGASSKNAEPIDQDDLLPGDLGLFYDGGSGGGSTNHVGIYLGDGYYIHCSSSKNGVVIGRVGFHVFRRVPGVDDAEIQPTKVHYSQSVEFNDDDVELMAKTIWHEVGGEGLNSWIAVGEVIMNRLFSDQFSYAHTLKDVIYAPHQFSGNSEIVKMKPSEKCYDVARAILSGQLRIFNNRNVLFFRNPGKGNNSDWGSFKFYRRVGNTVFYLGKS